MYVYIYVYIYIYVCVCLGFYAQKNWYVGRILFSFLSFFSIQRTYGTLNQNLVKFNYTPVIN